MIPKPTNSSNSDYPSRVGATIDAVNRRLKGNLLRNGAFQTWQRGTSFASGAVQYAPDGFQFTRDTSAAGATLSRQAGQVAQYAMRLQRNNADAGGTAINAFQSLESADCIPLVGLPVCVKMRARCGANFSASGGTFRVRLFTGTGIDQNVNTGFTGSATLIDASPSVSTAQGLVGDDGSIKGTIPAGVKQLGVWISYTPTGTAGANDWLEIEELQLVVGDYPGEYPYLTIMEEFALCQRWLPSVGGFVGPIGIGALASATDARIFVPFPVATRVPVTGIVVANAANFNVYDPTPRACSAFTFGSATPNGAWMDSTHATGAGAGGAVMVKSENVNTQILFTGAEL